MNPNTAIASVRGLCAFYARTQALFALDFDVVAGGVTALLGANGAGKTTTLRALSGMVRRQGHVELFGQQTGHLATDAIARAGVAHVPADRGTFAPLTVQENLLLGGHLQRDARLRAADIERMYGYFPRLRQRHRQQAGTLSGGEQQMLAIARALMGRPRLLMLDEPSFGLAPLVVQEVYRNLKAIRDNEGLSILLVEQNANLAFDIATHVYLLETGRIVASGPPAEMRSNSAVRDAYLGH